ncbi:MAG: nucleotide exchange factor GrpE [Clostridia bacterium]|nr:nucleotide exchange factor GrpE [Clostridia bacterium]
MNNEAEKKENNIEETAPEKETKESKGKTKAKLAEAEEKLAKAEAECAELNDKYLRLAAEYDNFRRRSAKEKEGLYADCFAEAISAFLPVIDNAERAAEYATDDSELAKGVLMLDKQLKDVLEKMKVEAIVSDGEQFDPKLHNAIMHEEDDESPENTVSQTLQKGYRIGDKVIRHALVKVVN